MSNNYKYQEIISANKIFNKIKHLAKKINAFYASETEKQGFSEEIVVIPVLNGALVFAGHLIPKLNFDLKILTIKASGYGLNTFSNQKPKLTFDFKKQDLKNKKILIIEDLIDKGHNLKSIIGLLKKQNVKEIKVCVLLNKLIPNPQTRNILIDWKGFDVPDYWIAGFGIDISEKLRNLDNIVIIKK